MRWGISHELNNTHMATTICLNEIKTCQKYSVGPNFIVNTFFNAFKGFNGLTILLKGVT